MLNGINTVTLEPNFKRISNQLFLNTREIARLQHIETTEVIYIIMTLSYKNVCFDITNQYLHRNEYLNSGKDSRPKIIWNLNNICIKYIFTLNYSKQHKEFSLFYAHLYSKQISNLDL